MIHCRHFLRCSMWWSSGAVLRLDRAIAYSNLGVAPILATTLQHQDICAKAAFCGFQNASDTHPSHTQPPSARRSRPLVFFPSLSVTDMCNSSVQNASTETHLSYTTSLVGCLYGRAPKPRPCPKYCRGLWHEHVGVRRSVLCPPKYAKNAFSKTSLRVIQ